LHPNQFVTSAIAARTLVIDGFALVIALLGISKAASQRVGGSASRRVSESASQQVSESAGRRVSANPTSANIAQSLRQAQARLWGTLRAADQCASPICEHRAEPSTSSGQARGTLSPSSSANSSTAISKSGDLRPGPDFRAQSTELRAQKNQKPCSPTPASQLAGEPRGH
jgi:hypothetical protein